MAVTQELIQQVRWEVADSDPALPILADDVYTYYLTKNNESVRRASMDAARAILFRLAMSSSEDTVDIFTIKGRHAAEQYRLALELFLKSPDLNPVLQNTQVYAGGISKSDMLANETIDNNTVKLPDQKTCTTECLTNPFIYCG